LWARAARTVNRFAGSTTKSFEIKSLAENE
jgi:hypothetical protein